MHLRQRLCCFLFPLHDAFDWWQVEFTLPCWPVGRAASFSRFAFQFLGRVCVQFLQAFQLFTVFVTELGEIGSAVGCLRLVKLHGKTLILLGDLGLFSQVFQEPCLGQFVADVRNSAH